MIKLFTHVDLDGIGCAVLAKLAFCDDVDIEYCNYDDIDEKVNDFYFDYTIDKNLREKYDHVYITDISILDKFAKRINNSSLSEHITLLDHHPTALDLNKYDWCLVSISNINGIKTSGTELFYQNLKSKQLFPEYLENSSYLKEFVEVVRNYDTWRWATLGKDGLICKQINDLMYIYGRDYFIEWCIDEIIGESFPTLFSEDKLVLKVKQQEIDKYIEEKNKTIFFGTLCDKKCGFVFADRYLSELGNKLCTMHPEIDFVAMIDIDNCTISYRTIKDDIDLGKDVAAQFGGGGHPKAAGSRFGIHIKGLIMAEMFKL